MPKKVTEMEIIRDEEPEPVKPVTVKTELSGPKFSLGVGTPPCPLSSRRGSGCIWPEAV